MNRVRMTTNMNKEAIHFHSERLEAHKDSSEFSKDPKGWMQKAEKEFGKKAEEAFIDGFIKAANAGMLPSTGAPNAQPQPNIPQTNTNTGGAQPPMTPSVAPQPQANGSMPSQGFSMDGGNQNPMQLLQQLLAQKGKGLMPVQSKYIQPPTQ